jgi:arylsulfatase A-like enzyme
LLIAAGPGVPHGRRDDLTLLDVSPTILQLAGLPAPDGLAGRAIATVG